MITVLLALFGTALQSPHTLWADAYEARESGITVATAQTYHVWAWVNSKDAAEITLGTETISVPADTSQSSYQWKHAGELSLPSGKIGVALSDNVAGVALATSDTFDPARVAADTRVNDEPVAIGDGRAGIDRDTNTNYAMGVFTDTVAITPTANSMAASDT